MRRLNSIRACRSTIAVAALIAAVFCFSGCGKKRKTARPPGSHPAKTVQMPRVGASEEGIASWYGPPYHGRRTANGEVYDMEEWTAAHQSLPFGVWVEVLNKRNAKKVQVRINDRGPFVDGRIIDLSKAAARSIDMIGPGIVPVRIRVIRLPESR